MLTPAEMEDLFEKIDRRLDRIEQILPTLATKNDLKVFATRDDLKVHATKDDLKGYATNDDLKAFATKADLQEAFAEAKRHANMLHEDLIDRIKLLGEGRRKRR